VERWPIRKSKRDHRKSTQNGPVKARPLSQHRSITRPGGVWVQMTTLICNGDPHLPLTWKFASAPAMRIRPRYASTLLVFGLGCGSGSIPATGEPRAGDSGPTGIEGTARFGPTRPVCQVDSPCTAPFSTGFEVWQDKRVVTRFQSDASGHFVVRLPPGTYTVTAGPSVGILIRSQVHQVTVKSGGLTHVDLDFDTGISKP
jgi:hypothetical protein